MRSLLIVSFALASLQFGPVLSQFEMSMYRDESVRQHNFVRQLHCVPAVSLAENLNEIAQSRANSLANNQTYEHDETQRFGENLWSISSSAILGYINGKTS
jgi:uncharacterized protein YkwD